MANILHKVDLAKIILIFAIVIGIAMRIDAWNSGAGNRVLSASRDSAMYNAIAKNLIAGKGYVGKDHMIARNGQPTVFYGPTYPFYLVFIYSIFGQSLKAVQISHFVLELITALLIYILGLRLFGGLQGAIAAFIYATSPQIIHYGFRIMTEIVYILLEVLVLLLIVGLLQREKPSPWMMASGGILFGVAYLCRQTIFVLPIVLIPILWLKYRTNGYIWVLRSAAIFLLGLAIVLMPWVVRNYMTFGEVIVGTTTGPATLWWGTLEDKGIPLSVLEKRYRDEHPKMNEVQMAHQMSKEAKYALLHMTKDEIIEKIINRPRRLFGYPKKIIDPNELKQTVTGIAYSLLGILGIAGLFIGFRGRYDRLVIPLFTLSAVGLHLLTHTTFRYLMPVVPLLALGFGNLVVYIAIAMKRGLKQSRGSYLTAS